MKEKKNKKALVLAIIGVLVLVLTIISATYAYFTVTGSSSTSSASIGATTEGVGTVTLTQGTSSLYLNVTSAQMSKANNGHDYYSTTTNTTAGTTLPTSSTAPTLATISISGGSSTTTYSCTFDLSVETKNNGGNATSYAALEGEDAEVVFFLGDGVSGITGKTLYQTKTKVTQTGSITLTGNASTTIKAYAVFHNLNKSQSDLQNLNMNVEVKVTNLSCGVAEPVIIEKTYTYYGWGVSSTDYSEAMASHNLCLRVDENDVVEHCVLINDYLICANSSTTDLNEKCSDAGGYYGSSTCATGDGNNTIDTNQSYVMMISGKPPNGTIWTYHCHASTNECNAYGGS